MQENEYQPGVCNINEIEIKRRWAAAYIGFVIYLVVVAVCVVYVDNYLVRLVAFFPALMASTGFVQARAKFCVAYAFAEKENAAPKSTKVQAVKDSAAILADKVRARALVIKAVGYAFLMLALALLIP